jgi:glutathione S-transferase
MKLHAPLGSFRSNKILTVAALTGQAVELQPWNPKSKDVMKKSPLKKFPLLELPDGTAIFESNAICRFLARESGLYQGSAEELAFIDNWMDFCLTDLDPAVCLWIYPILGLQEPDK